jgi:hypothetical protein
VKVSDDDWLSRFRSNEFVLRVGDSIKANVKITTKYDSDDQIISESHEILKVIAVRSPERNVQLKID